MLEAEILSDLVPKSKQNLFTLYMKYWQTGWQHFISDTRCTEIKQQQIILLEKAIRRDFQLSQNFLSCLQKAFVKEDLSLYLLLDMLTAWHYLAADKPPTSEEQLSKIIGATTSPLARMIMVLNDESPVTYLPMQELLSALLWYDLWQKKSVLVKKVRLTQRQKNNKLKGQMKSAMVLLAIVCHKRLKWRLALFLNKTAVLMQNNKQENIRVLDEIKIILYSIYQFITVRHRTMIRKGI
jgi:hypothetical protein